MRRARPVAEAPRWLRGCALVFAALGIGAVLTFSFGRDQGIYGAVAERWLHGAWPYAGAWDFKPPGIFLVYALVHATLGPSELALRAFEAAGLVGVLVGLRAYGCRVARSEAVGLVAGMLALLTHLGLDFWHTAQPETFGAPLLVAAILLTDVEGPLAALVLGLLGGFLFLLKPPLGAAAAMPTLVRLLHGRVSFRRIVGMALASLVPIAALVVAFRRAGAWPALVETLFVFAPGYTKLGWANATAATLVYDAVDRAFFWFSGPIALGLALRLLAPRPWSPHAPLLAALAVLVVGTALQAKLFPYHFGAILPLEALLAAEGYAWAVASGGPTARVAVVALAGFALAGRGSVRDLPGTLLERARARLAAWPAIVRGDRSVPDRLDAVAGLDQGENRALARWFAEEAREGETVFLFGFEPAVYLHARRAPASRYVYDVPLRSAGAEVHRARLLDDLRAAPPAAMALERFDRMPWVTGSNDDSLEAAHGFAAFMEFVRRDYERVDDLGRFERWRRRARAKNEDIAPSSDTIAP